MFERYNEKARRAIFFARYEASNYGSPYIEAEFLLLGLLREDNTLMRFFPSRTWAEDIRQEIDRHQPSRGRTSNSVDLPLSNESKHVLAYAAEESERLAHRHIGPEHLFLGILREEYSFAATLLQRYGANIDAVREDIVKHQPPEPHTGTTSINTSRNAPLGFFQLVLRVANLEASIDFYTKLGFTLAGDPHTRTVILTSGVFQLRLEQSPTPSHVLSFRNRDIAGAISLIQSAGLQFEQAPRTEADGSTTALLRDPDGNMVSLSNPPRPVPPAPPK